MKQLVYFLILIFSLPVMSEVKFSETNCQPETASELKIKMEDLGWNQTLEVMAEKFETVYNSGKRLEHRAYKDGKDFVLPAKNGQKVKLSANFLNNVKIHIETALKRKYAQYIFFSDMGHSHLFVDNDLYQNKVKDIDNQDIKTRYELILNDKKTRFLYHTAEQLRIVGEDKQPLTDKETQWRFYSRNIVGNNLQIPTLEIIYNDGHSHNTARAKNYDLKGEYRYWGSGFDISASKDGCFQYQSNEKTYYFDISLYALNYLNKGDDFDK